MFEKFYEKFPVIFVFLAFFLYYIIGRRFAAGNDFLKFNLPKWLRYFLFYAKIDNLKMNLSAIIWQIILNIELLTYVLKLTGIDVFSIFFGFSVNYMGMFKLQLFFLFVPLTIYTIVCEILIWLQTRG